MTSGRDSLEGGVGAFCSDMAQRRAWRRGRCSLGGDSLVFGTGFAVLAVFLTSVVFFFVLVVVCVFFVFCLVDLSPFRALWLSTGKVSAF